MSLEDRFPEPVWEIHILPCVGESVISLKHCCVVLVQEALDGRRRCQWYGEAAVRAFHHDDTMCRWGEAVPYSHLSVNFMLIRDNGAEGFRILYTRHEVAQDSYDS